MSTYYFDKIDGKDYKYSEIIQNILIHHGWKIDEYNPIYSNKNSKSKIKTYLDGLDEILLKHKLARNFKKYKFIPKTYIINRKTQIDHLKSGIWFLKPSDLLIGSGQQIELFNINSTTNVNELLSKFIKKSTTWVLQKEIKPLLIDGRKFDLRIFCVVTYIKNSLAVYLLDTGVVRFAQKLYEKIPDKTKLMTNISLYYGNNIAHTELFDCNHQYYYKMKDIRKILKIIMENICYKLKPNDKSGFIVLGCDVMLDYNENVKIIEINQHPTLYNNLEDSMLYHKGIEKILFKYFYDITLGAIIHNKLISHSYKNWKLVTNLFIDQ